jgi:cytochrome c553
MVRNEEMRYSIVIMILIVYQVSLQAKKSEDMPLLIDAMGKIKQGIAQSDFENVEIGVERVQSLIAELAPEEDTNLTHSPEIDEIKRLSESLKQQIKNGDKAQAEDRYVRIVNSCVTCHNEEKTSPIYHYFSKNLAWKLVH